MLKEAIFRVDGVAFTEKVRFGKGILSKIIPKIVKNRKIISFRTEMPTSPPGFAL